jgi:hypothetical protein
MSESTTDALALSPTASAPSTDAPSGGGEPPPPVTCILFDTTDRAIGMARPPRAFIWLQVDSRVFARQLEPDDRGRWLYREISIYPIARRDLAPVTQ